MNTSRDGESFGATWNHFEIMSGLLEAFLVRFWAYLVLTNRLWETVVFLYVVDTYTVPDMVGGTYSAKPLVYPEFVYLVIQIPCL